MMVVAEALPNVSVAPKVMGAISAALLYGVLGYRDRIHIDSDHKRFLLELLYVVLLGVGTQFAVDLAGFNQIEEPTLGAFIGTVQDCVYRLFWMNGIVDAPSTSIGVLWILFSVVFVRLVYRDILQGIPYVLTFAITLVAAGCGVILIRQNVSLPLTIAASSIGLFCYTMGAGFHRITGRMAAGQVFASEDRPVDDDGENSSGSNRDGGLISQFSGLIRSILEIAGEHPFLFLALYRMNLFYAFLWSGSGIAVTVCVQYLTVIALICTIERVWEHLGHSVSAPDAHRTRSIGVWYAHWTRLIDVLFYITFTAVFARAFISTTTYTQIQNANWNVALYQISEIILLSISLLRFWNDKSRRLMLMQGVILAVGCMEWYSQGRTALLLLCLLIVAAEGISARRILWIYLVVGVAIIVIAHILSLQGWISYYYKNGAHGLGIVYSTDYAAHWLYILIAWQLLWRRRHGIIYVLQGCIIYYVYHLSHSSTFLICSVLLWVLCYMVDYLPRGRVTHILGKTRATAGLILYPLVTVASYAVVLIVGPYSHELMGVTSASLFTFIERIRLSYEGFQRYPIRLFSQSVHERGSAGQVDFTTEYFFLDNSYVRMLIIYGICFLLIMLFVHMYCMKRCTIENNNILWCALIVIAIDAISEHHISNYAYNIIPVLAFAVWDLRSKAACQLTITNTNE